MALFHSPKTSTDGLVFMYDTGNRKSYVGEPTTNTAGTTNLATYWNNSGTASWSTDDTNVPRLFPDVPVLSMEKLTDGNSHIGVGYTSATVSTEYTYSVYVWIPSTNSSSMAGSVPYFRPQPANIFSGSLSYNGSTSWGTWPRNQWIRISITATTPSTNVTTAYISCYMNTTGDKIYFTCPQIEQKGHITPFVNGTRSSPQGLIDRTGNETIDLSNVSFDSNAQMNFDGTDDFIALVDNPQNGEHSVSWEFITKFDLVHDNETSTYRQLYIQESSVWIGQYYDYIGIDIAKDNGSWFDGNGGRNTNSKIGPVNSGQYYHVVFTWDGINVKGYLNGELGFTTAISGLTGIRNGVTPRRIGRRSGNPLIGEMPVVKLYNQALTSTEVTKNFNAIRSRFGL